MTLIGVSNFHIFDILRSCTLVTVESELKNLRFLNLKHPDSPDQLCRSHIMQFLYGNCKLE